MKLLLAKVWPYPLTYLDDKHKDKLLINTINTHSFNLTLEDQEFREALIKSDVLLPDGVGILLALRVLNKIKRNKIAGYDLLLYELNRLNKSGGKCFFLGSSEKVLHLIADRIKKEYPAILLSWYSPPFRDNFTNEENSAMIDVVNSFSPDVLFIGMTAPKQEKWAVKHYESLNARHICSIGAAFEFYAKTKKRSPEWLIRIWLEWFYRLIKEPVRLWQRYIIGIFKFLIMLFREKIGGDSEIIG